MCVCGLITAGKPHPVGQHAAFLAFHSSATNLAEADYSLDGPLTETELFIKSRCGSNVLFRRE